jgi:hypothetical protein
MRNVCETLCMDMNVDNKGKFKTQKRLTYA